MSRRCPAGRFGLLLSIVLLQLTDSTSISQHACECRYSWISETDDGCNVTQFGCPAQACDGDPVPWCIIPDDQIGQCIGERLDDGGGWQQCDPQTTPIQVITEPCQCKSAWISETDNGCDVTQYGCPAQACDGDSSPWCIIPDDQKGQCLGERLDDGGGWQQCNPNTTAIEVITEPCQCKHAWISETDNGCNVTQYGCPDPACDGDSSTWCIIPDDQKGKCLGERLDDGGGWQQCDNTTAIEVITEPCQCKFEWTSPTDNGCNVTQYGCPAQACDGDPVPWCIIPDYQKGRCVVERLDDGGGWQQCNPNTTAIEGKVTICHNPDRNPTTITVSTNALDAHIKHGDYLGACVTDNSTVVGGNVTIGGVENITDKTTYQGTVSYSTVGATVVVTSVTYSSTSSMIVNAARTFTGDGSITFEAGATAVFNAITQFLTSALVSFTSTTITSTSNLFFSGSLSMTTTTMDISAVVYFRGTANSLTGSTLSGNGSTTIDTAGAVVSSTNTVWSIALSTVAVTAARRSDFSTYATSFNSTTSVSWCNSDNGATTIATGTALIPDVSCSLSAAAAYSSRATSITFGSGSYVQFTGVSSSAHPVYAGALSAPSLIVEAIATGATGAFTVNLLEYPIGSLSSCYTSFQSTSIDGCATAHTCTITGSVNSANSSLCEIVFTQANPSPSPSPEDSNHGLYALFALFAVPVAVLFGLAILKICKPKAPVVVQEVVELETVDYPMVAYPAATYTDVQYVTPTPVY